MRTGEVALTGTIRLYADTPLGEGVEVSPDAAQSHYLLHVMRLSEGDDVRVFNARDGEWSARVTPEGRRACRLVVYARLRPPQQEPGPALIFAPIRRERAQVLVEKATELGTARLQPVLTRHTAHPHVNAERLRRQTIEAAEQCERLSIPEIPSPQSLPALLAGWSSSLPLLFMDETGGAPIAETVQALSQHGSPPPTDLVTVGILVGPEGGFPEDEAHMVRAHAGVRRVSLGPRILRTETAALATLACWQALAGDWRPAGSRPTRITP